MPPLSLFISYSFSDALFAKSLHHFLAKQSALHTFFWSEDGQGDDFRRELDRKLDETDVFVAVVSETIGPMQLYEIVSFNQMREKEIDSGTADPKRRWMIIQLGAGLPAGLQTLLDRVELIYPAKLTNLTNVSARALECARDIFRRLALHWVPDDGLPKGYLFEKEKTIVSEYSRNNGHASPEMVGKGCPAEWPDVDMKEGWYQNPLDEGEIGKFGADDDRVVVKVRPQQGLEDKVLTFREARPRKRLYYPERGGARRLGVGVVVSGGIAPGINSVIDGIAKRHHSYLRESRRQGLSYDLELRGYVEGFRAFFHVGSDNCKVLVDRPGKHYDPREVATAQYADQGGSVLGTSRAAELLAKDPADRLRNLEKIIGRLVNDGVQILYVIGGDGSMRAAHALHTTAMRLKQQLAVIGIPKTMDNDILWIWQSFGFLSAVEKAREAILSMQTEVSSNPRLGIIQLFGSDSGFVASHAAYSTDCDLVLIPEDPLTLQQMVDHLVQRFKERVAESRILQSPYGLMVMAETSFPTDVDKYIEDNDVKLSVEEKQTLLEFKESEWRVTGQTPDHLRTAALKMVARLLGDRIKKVEPTPARGQQPRSEPQPYWKDFRVVTSEPRHLIRSIRPSVSDVVFGERLGTLAVDNAMAGYRDCMVSQWLTEFVLVPLELVVLGRKRVPIDGIFWKSVRARTGQPAGTPRDSPPAD